MSDSVMRRTVADSRQLLEVVKLLELLTVLQTHDVLIQILVPLHHEHEGASVA